MTKRIALVTGAGSGIGAVTAAALLKDGWDTVLTGRRREALEEAITVSVNAKVTYSATAPSWIGG